MYEECLKCKRIGNSCDGPNFLALGTADLIEWCNARRKQLPGMTYDRIADETGLSKGTVSGFFAGTHADYRLETIRPILKLLVGGEWSENPCADPTDNERAKYEEKIRQFESDIAWRDDKIQHFKEQNARLQDELADKTKRHHESQEFMRSEMKRKNKSIAVLATFLGISLFVIIAALVIDRLNPEIGFFWLKSVLDGTGLAKRFIG